MSGQVSSGQTGVGCCRPGQMQQQKPRLPHTAQRIWTKRTVFRVGREGELRYHLFSCGSCHGDECRWLLCCTPSRVLSPLLLPALSLLLSAASVQLSIPS